jgi:UDP-3-O-[3-hydroxymyristoyl] N-acetylglucosamine deacetylase
MGNELFDCQSTLREPVSVSGVGVHNGKPVTVHFSPADPDTGVVFHGSLNGDDDQEIRASAAAISGTDLCTLLGNPAGFHVGTVEHLMATLFALGIDNVHVEIDGNEMPILDGSAAMFVDAFDQAGIEAQAVRRQYIRVLKPVRIENGASWAEFRPHDGTRFEVEIDFDSPAIGRQSFHGDIDAQVFRRDIARARTFGFLRDVERLWAAGYALGSSLENSVVIGEDHRVINVEGLRYKDEFVRHKTLDAIGDLALAGARFIGLFRSYRGGHKLNAAALRQLLSDPTAFEIVETARRERGRSAEMVQVSAPVYAPWAI